MTIHKRIVSPYGDSRSDGKERSAFEKLYARLGELVDQNDDAYLFANANINGAEIDAIVLAADSIMVVDFKSYPSGTVLFRDHEGMETNRIENASWYMKTGQGQELEIKGGAGGKNPYEQLRINRSKLSQSLKSANERVSLLEANQGGVPYVSAVVCFDRPVHFPNDKLADSGLDLWFRVVDVESFVLLRKRRALAKAELSAVAEYIQYRRLEEWLAQTTPAHASHRHSATPTPQRSPTYDFGCASEQPTTDVPRTTRRASSAAIRRTNWRLKRLGSLLGTLAMIPAVLPLLLVLSYPILGVALWARPIVGLFGRIFGLVPESDLSDLSVYTGESWVFGMADTWFAGGDFNTWSLAWCIGWLATIATAPIFLVIVGLWLAFMIALAIVGLLLLVVWYFVDNPY